VLLILITAAPVAAMTALFLTCRTRPSSEAPTPQGAHRPAMEGRWEALSAEVARLERRHRSPGSDAAMRRRHLAAVLPADARR